MLPIDLAIGPSVHLTWKELGCKDGTPYPNEWRSNRAIQLSGVFEHIRQVCGNKPITVLSAYRTPTYNAKVGGAKASQHIQGRAIDLRPPNKMSINEFYSIIRLLPKSTAVRGIGKYTTFIHVDIRSGDHVALWYGPGVNA
jgi:uncharacterized protein YcbK (DUF882 family)